MFRTAVDATRLWSIEGMRQITPTPNMDCTATWDYRVKKRVVGSGTPPRSELEYLPFLPFLKALRRWSSGGGG